LTEKENAMWKSSSWMILGCVAVALAAAWSDSLKAQPGPLKGAEGEQPATLEALKILLDNMGYDYQENTDKEGKVTGFTVKLSRDGWNFVLSIAPSGNQRWIWLTAWLRTPKEGWPPAVLKKMLEHNHRVALPYFAIDVGDNQVKLATPLHNKGITAALLRNTIDDLCTAIKSTANLWNPEQWDSADKVAAKETLAGKP
jgi:hypothetical protein